MISNRIHILFKIWLPLILISTVVVLPIKGSTPAFVFAFLSVLFTSTSFERNRFVYNFILFIILFLTLYLISQYLNIVYNNSVRNLETVNKGIDRVLFVPSHFTQSLYLIPGVLLFFSIRYYFKNNYWKYVNYGVIFFCLFGLYEFVFFALTGANGDFLSNRSYGESVEVGSAFQSITINGVTVRRVKSLALEPSLLAFTLMPFFNYYIYTKSKFLSLLTLSCLLLSTSTSFVLGLFVFLMSDIFYRIVNGLEKKVLLSYFIVLLFLIFIITKYWDVFEFFFEFSSSKLTLDSDSGIDRFGNFEKHFNYWLNLPFLSKLFGIGFGTVRSLDMFSTLIVNVGLIGLVFYILLFLIPYFKLNSRIVEERGLKWACVQLLVISLVSVPEFSYLVIWFFLGLSYKKIYDNKKIIY